MTQVKTSVKYSYQVANFGKPYDIETLDAFEIPASKWTRALILEGSTQL